MYNQGSQYFECINLHLHIYQLHITLTLHSQSLYNYVSIKNENLDQQGSERGKRKEQVRRTNMGIST